MPVGLGARKGPEGLTRVGCNDTFVLGPDSTGGVWWHLCVKNNCHGGGVVTPLCQEVVGTGVCDNILCQDTDTGRRHCGVENTEGKARGGRGDAFVS